MNRKTVAEINDLLKGYDHFTNVLNRESHSVTVEGRNRDYEGHVCDRARCDLDFEDVKPLIEKKREAIIQELKKLGFEEADKCAE